MGSHRFYNYPEAIGKIEAGKMPALPDRTDLQMAKHLEAGKMPALPDRTELQMAKHLEAGRMRRSRESTANSEPVEQDAVA
ncbi:MAG: hypothetical protein K2X77_13110 [Candidatus Obscuribacterales bacterium]|nr:hypothetical protein [Candidatus Obscuribacterales bacterium]